MKVASATKTAGKEKKHRPPESDSRTSRSRELENGAPTGMPLFLQRSAAPSAPVIQRSGEGLAYGVNLSSPVGGKNLPTQVRAKMENSLGADFSDVRVHEDGQAEKLGAQAFTKDNDVHFAQGKYDPASQSGQSLIGHELAHVVQQREGRVSAPTGASVVQHPGLEAEADALGAQAAASPNVNAQFNQSPKHVVAANPTVQQKPVVQGLLPALRAIGAKLLGLSAADGAAVAGAVIAGGYAAAAVGQGIQPEQTGVQEAQLENGWMSRTDQLLFQLVIQYRLINAYVDHWLRTHGAAVPTAAPTRTPSTAPATPTSAGAATEPPKVDEREGEVNQTIMETVKTVVQLQIEQELNRNQFEAPGSYEFIWSDSGEHEADWFGTVGAIEFVGLKGTWLSDSLRLNETASQIPNLNPAMRGEFVTIRQFRGGRLVRGSEMEAGLMDALGINLVGTGPTIDQAGNEGHGVHTYDTAWNWDDNTTHWAFDVKILGGGYPEVTAQPSRGEPED